MHRHGCTRRREQQMAMLPLPRAAKSTRLDHQQLRHKLAVLPGEAQERHSKMLTNEIDLSFLRRDNEELKIRFKKLKMANK